MFPLLCHWALLQPSPAPLTLSVRRLPPHNPILESCHSLFLESRHSLVLESRHSLVLESRHTRPGELSLTQTPAHHKCCGAGWGGSLLRYLGDTSAVIRNRPKPGGSLGFNSPHFLSLWSLTTPSPGLLTPEVSFQLFYDRAVNF